MRSRDDSIAGSAVAEGEAVSLFINRKSLESIIVCCARSLKKFISHDCTVPQIRYSAAQQMTWYVTQHQMHY